MGQEKLLPPVHSALCSCSWFREQATVPSQQHGTFFPWLLPGMFHIHLHLLLWGAISMTDDCNNAAQLHPGETQDRNDKCAPTPQNCHQEAASHCSFTSILQTVGFLSRDRISPRLNQTQVPWLQRESKLCRHYQVEWFHTSVQRSQGNKDHKETFAFGLLALCARKLVRPKVSNEGLLSIWVI